MMQVMMKSNPVFKDIHNKIFVNGENCIVLFLGKVRKGKSFCSITLAEHIDPNFNIDNNFVYDVQAFYKILNDDSSDVCSLIIEELGVKFDKRRFMSLQNIILSHTFQTFAYKDLLLILNCPSMGYVDPRIEPLIDYSFTVRKAYKKKRLLQKTTFKVRQYQHNPVRNKTYKKRPIFWLGDKKVMINEITIPVPSEDVIAKYKKVSHIWKDKLSVELEGRMNIQLEKDNTPTQPTKTDDEMISEVIAMKDNLVIQYRGKPYISPKVILGLYDDVGVKRANKIAAKTNLILSKVIPPIPS
jgi:hypothetical protein